MSERMPSSLPERLYAPEQPAGPLLDGDLLPYRLFFTRRMAAYRAEKERLEARYGSLRDYADLHQKLGLHKLQNERGEHFWLWREYMPAAQELWLATDQQGFDGSTGFAFQREEGGVWALTLPESALRHGSYMELRLRPAHDPQGKVRRRVPAFAIWVEQDAANEEQWCARLWDPPQPYEFRHGRRPEALHFPRIYEAHVGMAQPLLGRQEKSVGSFAAFRRDLLPYIKDCGYSAVQLMGVLEHPLYKSFGYQVTSYFAVSSRFGTPEEFKELVDAAHGLGLAVILDIPHSHCAPNTEQGLARYDGSDYFFRRGGNQWGTASFDYSQEITRRFLLSNCRYWLEEFRVDGFRFDAVGNMVYLDHGVGDDFSDLRRSFYDEQGNKRLDEAGVLYLCLANDLIHELAPGAISIAEEFSGLPGLTSPPQQGGLGFDYRFAMGVPDYWGKFIKDEGNARSLGSMWYELNNYRHYDRTISYSACHDQCINGKDAMIWRLIGDDMYQYMSRFHSSWKASRGVALYKMMRLATLACADSGYLNFMGDEFGHPEWLDAEAYGHRQWQLPLDENLKYSGLAAFDRDCLLAMVAGRMTDFEQRPVFRFIHEADRCLAFERGELLFVFNFHETKALENWEIPVRPGKYQEWISTDSPRYAGHGNLDPSKGVVEHFSRQLPQSALQRISLYLPPLVGLILIREV